MRDPAPDSTVRPSSRVLLLDPRDRLLLLCYRSPRSRKRWWITVGGGLDAGETHEAAALRELREETGMHGLELGPCVWTYDHRILDLAGRPLAVRERFFVVRALSDRIDTSGWDEVEQRVLIEYRWWSLEDIAVAERAFGPDEAFEPPGLADLLRPIMEGAFPGEPIAIGT